MVFSELIPSTCNCRIDRPTNCSASKSSISRGDWTEGMKLIMPLRAHSTRRFRLGASHQEACRVTHAKPGADTWGVSAWPHHLGACPAGSFQYLRTQGTPTARPGPPPTTPSATRPRQVQNLLRTLRSVHPHGAPSRWTTVCRSPRRPRHRGPTRPRPGYRIGPPCHPSRRARTVAFWSPTSRSGHRRPGRRRPCPQDERVAFEADPYCGPGRGHHSLHPAYIRPLSNTETST